MRRVSKCCGGKRKERRKLEFRVNLGLASFDDHVLPVPPTSKLSPTTLSSRTNADTLANIYKCAACNAVEAIFFFPSGSWTRSWEG